MRMLKYAILGLVNQSPMSGYDIMKAFEGSISKFWEAKHSQIYPELSRLQDEGLVEHTVSIQGVKLEKKMYTVTPEGEQDLRHWLCGTAPIEPVPKESFRLKLYFSECLSKEQLQPVFVYQYAQHKARLDATTARYEQLRSPLPSMDSQEFGEYMLVRGGMYREQAYLEWLAECADLLSLDGLSPDLTNS